MTTRLQFADLAQANGWDITLDEGTEEGRRCVYARGSIRIQIWYGRMDIPYRASRAYGLALPTIMDGAALGSLPRIFTQPGSPADLASRSLPDAEDWAALAERYGWYDATRYDRNDIAAVEFSWRRGDDRIRVRFGSRGQLTHCWFNGEPHRNLSDAHTLLLTQQPEQEPVALADDLPVPLMERYRINDFGNEEERDRITDALADLYEYRLTANEVNHLYREFLANEQGRES
jgi:hypothetical protein